MNGMLTKYTYAIELLELVGDQIPEDHPRFSNKNE